MRLGYRESSPPFSFLDQSNRPIGYSLELCEAVVDEIGAEVDDPNLKIEYVKVTSDDRIPAVRAEQDRPRMRIDHRQCRARQAGGVLAADVRGRHQADGAEGLADLGGGGSQGQDRGGDQGHHQRAGDARGRQEARRSASISSCRPTTSNPTRCWSDGKADAFATDDILLYGLIARHKSQDKFRVTGDYLSYDPYGIMFRKGEPQLAAVVERAFRKLGTNHDLIPLYNKWFLSRLPTGEKLNVAISPQLEDAFKVLDDSPQGAN